MYQYLMIETHGYIKRITFNRPEKANALSIEFMREITDCAQSLHKDINTRVVVFRGEGKHFCTGADLSDPEQIKRAELGMLERLRSLDDGSNMIKAIYQIPQITIASLKGKTLGGGACIASACDFRIGANHSEVGYPEANYGMNLSWLGLPLCVHLVGPAKAKRMVVLGRHEQAADLKDWGFIDELVPFDELDDYSMKYAEAYSKQAPISAQMIKKSVNQIVSALDQSIMHMDKDQFLLSNLSEDYREGLVAFLKGQEPEFKGK